MKSVSELLLYSPYNGNTGDPHGSVFEPGDNGLMAHTFPVTDMLANTTFFTTVTSTLYMAKLKLDRPATPANIVIAVQTAGLTYTSSDVALFNNTGTRLAVSASQNAVFTSTGIKTIAISPGALTPGYYHVAIRQTATTPAKFWGFAPSIDLGNAGLGASDARWASVASQTTMPSSVTMSSRVASTNYTWAALS